LGDAVTAVHRTPPDLRLPIAGVLHAAIVIVGAAASLFMLRHDSDTAVLVAAASSAYVIGLALYRAYRLTGDALNAFSISMTVMLLLYPFHALVMRDSPVALNLLGADRYEYFVYGLLVTLPAVWIMYLGFRTGRAGRISRLSERLSRPIDDRSPAITKKLAVLAVVGVIARALLVATGTGTYVALADASSGGSSAHFILDLIASTTLIVALYLLATGAKYRNLPRLGIAVGMILLEAVWGGFFSGSRYLLFVPLLSAAAVYSAAVKPLSLRRLIIVVALFLLVALPVATAYKSAYLSRIVELQRQGLSTSAVLDSLESTDFDSRTGEWSDLIGQRFHSLMSLALIIRYTPERHPYMWGVPYFLLPLDIAIPRVIWPDKPVLRQFALDFRFDYFRLERGSMTTVKTSQFGELWANLGLFGVLLGAWFWGRILRFLYSFQYLGGRLSLFGKAAYASAVPGLVSVIETDQATGMAFVAKSLIVWMAWTWFLGERRPRPARVAPVRNPVTRLVEPR